MQRTVRPATKGLRLEFPLFGELVLEVRGADGAPVPTLLRVDWWRTGTPHSAAADGARIGFMAQADGCFHFPLPRVSWDLEVGAVGEAQGHIDGVPVTAEPRREVLQLPSGTDVELRFAPANGVAPGRGLLSLITPDEMARATAGDLSFDPFLLRRLRPLPAEPAERVTVPHLAPGTYEFAYLPKGWTLEPATFEVPDVAQHVVELTWRRK